MNIRPSILLGGIALLAGLCVILWLSKRPSGTGIDASEISEPPADPDSASAERGPVSNAPASENDVPIVFYGRLEDQAAEPVAEAEVTGTTVYHVGTAKGTGRFSTKSGTDGYFKIEAGAGESLELMPRKEGYSLASTNNVAFYGSSEPEKERRHPDPNNPVIIKMWKLQGAEPLAAFDSQFSLGVSQAPAHFDFVTQALASTNGDIRISVAPPTGSGSTADASDWRVEIEGEGAGGLMQVTSNQWSTTYWAPVDGFESKRVLLLSTNAQWSQETNALFFVQSRHGGVYTKLLLKVRNSLSPTDPLDFEISGISNTNGSCNWEGDPGTLNQK